MPTTSICSSTSDPTCEGYGPPVTTTPGIAVVPPTTTTATTTVKTSTTPRVSRVVTTPQVTTVPTSTVVEHKPTLPFTGAELWSPALGALIVVFIGLAIIGLTKLERRG